MFYRPSECVGSLCLFGFIWPQNWLNSIQHSRLPLQLHRLHTLLLACYKTTEERSTSRAWSAYNKNNDIKIMPYYYWFYKSQNTVTFMLSRLIWRERWPEPHSVFRESMASFELLCTTFPDDNCMVTGREILTEVRHWTQTPAQVNPPVGPPDTSSSDQLHVQKVAEWMNVYELYLVIYTKCERETIGHNLQVKVISHWTRLVCLFPTWIK